jgi:hypothetical protein
MRPVTDAFLLQVAEVSATLLGLFLVGVFFFAETGFRRLHGREVVQPYFRAGTRIVLLLLALPLGLSLTLVTLEMDWNRVLFAIISVLLLAANADTLRRISAVAGVSGRASALVLNELLGTAAVLALVVIPWALGGLDPSREDLTWSILLSLGAGFVSASAVVLSVFDSETA